MEKKTNGGNAPKIRVMSPTVVNVSNVPRENVALERVVSRDPDDEKNFLPEDLIASGVLDGIECVHSNADYPGKCGWHTSEFCKMRCAFNSAIEGYSPCKDEIPLDDFGDFDYSREDGK